MIPDLEGEGLRPAMNLWKCLGEEKEAKRSRQPRSHCYYL